MCIYWEDLSEPQVVDTLTEFCYVVIREHRVEDNNFVDDTVPLATFATARVSTDIDLFGRCPRRSFCIFRVLEFSVHVDMELGAIPCADEVYPFFRREFITEDFKFPTAVGGTDMERRLRAILPVFMCPVPSRYWDQVEHPSPFHMTHFPVGSSAA